MRHSLAIFSPNASNAPLEISLGHFSEAKIYASPEGNPSQSSHLKACAKIAEANGHTWLIVLSENEAITENALELLAPSLPLYDAVFGAAVMQDAPTKVMRLTRLAFDELITLPHALLNWWLPNEPFIKTKCLQKALENMEEGEGELWLLSFKLYLWSNVKSMKTAQPLLALAQEPHPISPPARAYLRSWLADEQLFMEVPFNERIYYLPYTGQNAGIEREQTRGMFFEQQELLFLKSQISAGATIVDIGANTGNHTLFFATVMAAEKVIPFEAISETANVLKNTIMKNELDNVDVSKLEIGLASEEGRARVITSQSGGWGATKLIPDTNGTLPIQPLDNVLDEKVDFIKIDVEGLELEVLKGAQQTLATHRPAIFIEITNENTMDFMNWLESADYEIKRIFPDKGHANYFAMPSSTKA